MSEITIKWHGMICPMCHTDNALSVFVGIVKLEETHEETTREVEQKLGGMGNIRCGCGFMAPGLFFQTWGEVGEVIDFAYWPDDVGPSEFEGEIVGMAEDKIGEVTGEVGSHTLAESLGVEPEYFAAVVYRNTMGAGGVKEIMLEADNLPTYDEAVKTMATWRILSGFDWEVAED